MIEQTLEVGPFTPQELEDICEKLKSRKVSFEILKDEETEKSEMASDYANIVKKTEYRLETYLGQVFYLRMQQQDFKAQKSLFAHYGMATTPQEHPDELNATDLTEVKKESKEQKRLQTLLAWALLALLAAGLLFPVIHKFFNE